MSREVSDPNFLAGLGLDDGPSIKRSKQYPKDTGYDALLKEGITDTKHLDDLNKLVEVDLQKKAADETAYKELMKYIRDGGLDDDNNNNNKEGGSRRNTRRRRRTRRRRNTRKRTRTKTRRSRRSRK
jgi:hypothetical protein